jgi:hypothetical protein
VDVLLWPEDRLSNEVAVLRARHWPTRIDRTQYEKVTGASDFPDCLQSQLDDEGALPYYGNARRCMRQGRARQARGDVGLRGAKWDRRHALFDVRGSRAHVIIRQGAGRTTSPSSTWSRLPTRTLAGWNGRCALRSSGFKASIQVYR